MSKFSDDAPPDLEKDVSVSSETEGSHTHGAEEDPTIPIVYHRRRDDKEAVVVASSSGRSPATSVVPVTFLGLAVVATVIVLPCLLLGNKNDGKIHGEITNLSNSKNNNLVAFNPDEDEGLTLSTTTTTSSTAETLTGTNEVPLSHNYDLDTFEFTGQENDQCPGHLDEEGEYWEVAQVWAFGLSLGQRGTDVSDRTFEVEPSHEVLQDAGGVVFNVETVPEPLQEDVRKPILSQSDMYQVVKEEASEFYQNTTAAMSYPIPPLPNVSIEVLSRTTTAAEGDRPVVFAGHHGFLAGCMMAFAQHLPLALSPDHIWTVIVQGFGRHVDQNAEELRSKFVDFEGKQEIRIREDGMRLGASPPELWEDLIFPKFSHEIGNSMKNQEAYETLSAKVFSTSTSTSQAASEIVLMSSMKEFFEYTMVTACGIPKIRLEGSRQDWVLLRERTEKLSQWMLQDNTHGDLWIHDIVLPILEQFLLAYDGHVNYCFWQNMVKFRSTGGGSGSYDFLSGWLGTLFPYLSMGEGQTKPNPFLRRWEESASALMEGPTPGQIPSQVSSVPVRWDYFGTDYPIHFHAGFRGVAQEDDGTLSPVLGWYVTHDPDPQR